MTELIVAFRNFAIVPKSGDVERMWDKLAA